MSDTAVPPPEMLPGPPITLDELYALVEAGSLNVSRPVDHLILRQAGAADQHIYRVIFEAPG